MTDPDQSSPEPQRICYPLRFQFFLAGARFEAVVTKQSDGIHLGLEGAVGDIPYSVEGRDHRAAMLQAIAEKGPDSPWVITPNQRLVFRTGFLVSGQPSLIRFFTEALRAALARAPRSLTASVPA